MNQDTSIAIMARRLRLASWNESEVEIYTSNGHALSGKILDVSGFIVEFRDPVKGSVSIPVHAISYVKDLPSE